MTVAVRFATSRSQGERKSGVGGLGRMRAQGFGVFGFKV